MLGSGPILVPLDGSPLAEKSLPYAVEVGRALGKRLVLMTAAYVSDIPGYPTWTGEFESQPRDVCEAYLEGLRTRLGAGNIDTLVRVGYPHEEIPHAIDATKAAMVVIATHGRSGISRWVYGSTASSLLQSARVPLFVVAKGLLERDESTVSFQHMMVPVDATPLSEAALPVAVELAEKLGSRMTLVRVVPWAVQAYPYFTPGMYVPELDVELEKGAKAYLQRIRDGVKGVEADTELVRGPAADGLLTYAEGNGVDLVVMTTHARSGIGRVVLGSTADRMLQGPAPVVFLRPD
jgi:nucleotide-binding universal stress UspA family protein